jgi:hypothetical protein
MPVFAFHPPQEPQATLPRASSHGLDSQPGVSCLLDQEPAFDRVIANVAVEQRGVLQGVLQKVRHLFELAQISEQAAL